MIEILRGTERKLIECAAGERLNEALNRAQVSIGAPCGGRGTCGKCKAQILHACPEATQADRRHLSEGEIQAGVRLACQVRAVDGMVVRLAEDKAMVVTEGGAEAEYKLDPPVQLRAGQIAAPSLEHPVSDTDRFLTALDAQGADVDLRLMERMHVLARGSETVYGALFADEGRSALIAASASPMRALALAYDIGTTTIAGYLMDLTSGELLGTASCLNPQRPYGADVITRAEYASSEADGLNRLSALVRACAVELADDMLTRAQASRADVMHVCFVGNTVMMHLLLGLQPRHIAVLPFVPVNTRMLHVSAGEMRLPFENARVTAGPCVSGYVGADTVAAVLSADMDVSDEVNLLIDIGTNGEIVLGRGGQLYCCSAAAGPAFEGAHIRCGSGAVDGAVDRVRISDGRVEITTIRGIAPGSICGSGIVDAVAGMYANEILDETGRLDPDEAPDEYQQYLQESEGGTAFRLAENVFICQKDIREVQLAKAAIAAGIETLLEVSGFQESDIHALYLAGGFGNYIDRNSAAAIGLIPQSLVERVRPIGNAAGSGCRRMTLERAALRRAREMTQSMRYIELSASPDFQERFAENMLFPEMQ